MKRLNTLTAFYLLSVRMDGEARVLRSRAAANMALIVVFFLDGAEINLVP